MNLEKVQRHGMHEHCYLNCLLKSSSSDNPRLKSCNLLLIWFIRVKTQIIKTAVFTPSPASRTEAKALDGYFMSEVAWQPGLKAMGTAWCGWASHYSCLETKSLYIRKSSLDLYLGKNYLQQEWRWGRGCEYTCVLGKREERLMTQ